MKDNRFVYDRLRLNLFPYPISLSVVDYRCEIFDASRDSYFIYLFIHFDLFTDVYNNKYAKTSRLARKYMYKNSEL